MIFDDFAEKLPNLDDAITNYARNMQPITQSPSIEAIANSKYSKVTLENGEIWD